MAPSSSWGASTSRTSVATNCRRRRRKNAPNSQIAPTPRTACRWSSTRATPTSRPAMPTSAFSPHTTASASAPGGSVAASTSPRITRLMTTAAPGTAPPMMPAPPSVLTSIRATKPGATATSTCRIAAKRAASAAFSTTTTNPPTLRQAPPSPVPLAKAGLPPICPSSGSAKTPLTARANAPSSSTGAAATLNSTCSTIGAPTSACKAAAAPNPS